MAVYVYAGRQRLEGYTSLRLTRKKDDLTGELDITIFMDYMPNEPVLASVAAGEEILVYVGGHLAFNGTVDRRLDVGSRTPFAVDIGPNNYSVTFRCRGKTKELIDSSHQHPTGTMLRPTNFDVAQTLCAPWGLLLDWRAEVLQMDKFRMRDGARVVDELQRLADMSSLYFYETRAGTLRVEDGTVPNPEGEALVLGTNILSFGCDQAFDHARSEVLVKGQRTEANTWGDQAVLPTMTRMSLENEAIGQKPQTVQLYGDATPEFLNRRATYEANKRSGESRNISLEVFHVQQSNSMPWDIGELHYVEIPPAGVYAVMEIVEVTYMVENDRTLKTRITLSPTPVTINSSSNSGLLGIAGATNLGSMASIRSGGNASDVWSGLQVSFINGLLAATGLDRVLNYFDNYLDQPPLYIPEDEDG